MAVSFENLPCSIGRSIVVCLRKGSISLSRDHLYRALEIRLHHHPNQLLVSYLKLDWDMQIDATKGKRGYLMVFEFYGAGDQWGDMDVDGSLVC